MKNKPKIAGEIDNLGVGEILVINGVDFYVESYTFDGNRRDIRLSDKPQKAWWH